MALLRISSNQNKMLKYFKKMTDHFNGTGVEGRDDEGAELWYINPCTKPEQIKKRGEALQNFKSAAQRLVYSIHYKSHVDKTSVHLVFKLQLSQLLYSAFSITCTSP